ncbi:MAG TPA: sulfide/dihydroorotate dehydrogenase-like FAD/NAD-binding protein [Syntrophales bacterium]|nr:sulfide/dihydroorotate dehydrogenase-like FAD/NAD-binding protein [Geobacteraceae bacterium]HPQ43820.1 sulfide/dihydroorotate dehydrogenase-like FAD/NAD-binding protein [Syntrophales bacterium]
MHKIVVHERIGKDVNRIVIEAAQIAKKRKAGQFIILRIDDFGERIPLTIADANPEEGTITLIYQTAGKTTGQLSQMEVGESILDVVGPLGQPTHIEKYGTVVCVGGGIGKAPLFPIAEALKKAGNYVISIVGARGKDLEILEDELQVVSDELIVCTDDGSHGRMALVTEPLKEILESGKKVDLCIAIGPAVMMKFVCKVTEEYNIPTVVSLNALMVDGTGMCGCCRVNIGGETKFTCVDGPEFDGHKVDWELMIKRLSAYDEQEAEALKNWENRRAMDVEARKKRLSKLEAEIRKVKNSDW